MARRYLGVVPQLAVGIRLPDVVAPPVIKAFKLGDMVGTLMLSYNRETAPSEVIKSPPNPLLGHTGTSISEYISKAGEYADRFEALIQVEADHVSIMSSPERAIKRITGGGFEYGLSEEEVRRALNYIEREFKEVREAGGVDFVTIDTCELIDLRVDSLGREELISLYEERIDEGVRRDLRRRYVGRTYRFFLSDGSVYEVRLDEESVARLALKYLRSVEYVAVVKELISRYLEGREFGVEVALDETPKPTRPEELFFYLNELRIQGINPDFIAPNVGFSKREDFRGDLTELTERLDILSSIARSFGSLLSFHSGSGSHPWSDKGLGTWSAVSEGCGGLLKYKVSGVMIQLLLEVMASFPKGSRVRALFEEIYDEVIKEVRRHVEGRTQLYSQHLERMLRDYEAAASRDPSKRYDVRADVFRHYFFLFQALMNDGGRRWLREEVIRAYEEVEELRRRYEREVIDLILRMAWKLNLTGNYVRYGVSIH